VRPRSGERDAAQHRLGPHRGVGQPQPVFYASILHAPDNRAVPHLLHPLQDFIDIPFPVHEMHQPRRGGSPCSPGRFPHDLTSLVDAVKPFAAFLGRRARRVSRRPRPGLEPQDAEHCPRLGQGQGAMEQYPLGQVPSTDRPQLWQHVAPRKIQRGGILDHQHGGLRQALPGRVTRETLVQGAWTHPLVGEEAIDPLGLSPAARRLRDGIAWPLRERFQDAGQASPESFVRQNRFRRHPRGPECVHVHSASPTRSQSVLSAAPFLLSTICPLVLSRGSQKLWVMVRAESA